MIESLLLTIQQKMQKMPELQFVQGIIRHLQYFYDYLQKPNHSEETDQFELDEECQTKSNNELESLSNGFDNLNSEITECKKQKLLKEHQLLNKPKKPISSFVFYFREQIKRRDHPSNEKEVGKLAKIISQQWKTLPLEVKQPYYQQAEKSKVAYKQNMKNYNVEHAQEIEQIQKLKRMANNKLRRLRRRKQYKTNETIIKRRRQRRQRTKIIEPDIGIQKPKIPLSSFFVYFQENGPRITQSYHQNRRSKLVQFASQQWKLMSKKEKEKYENIAKINKETYERQLGEYNIRSNQILKEKLAQEARQTQKTLEQAQSQAQISGKANEISKTTEIKVLQESFSDNTSQTSELGIKKQIDSQVPSLSSSSSQIGDQQFSSSESYVENETAANSKINARIPLQQQNKVQITKSAIVKEIAKEGIKEVPKKKCRRGKRRSKSTHKPKGPVSSFFLYYNCIVRELKKEYPDQRGSELVKIASQRWSLLSEQEKQIYQQQAKRGRQLYDEEMNIFQKQYPEEASKMKYFKKKRDK